MKLKYKKTIALLVLITSLTIQLNAESQSKKYAIIGIVTDSISNEGLPYAAVRVLNIKDSTLVKGVTTDFNGNYFADNLTEGKYLVTVSYMGYFEKSKEISIYQENTKCNFSLNQNNIVLSEISITAEKNLIEKSIEKTTVNMSKNMTVAGGSAIDVMKTLPSVDYDIDGNLNYRGSNKVILLVNGEKSGLISSLDQIPAEQIEKVELINNPSAKYESEGMSGIINIVLKKGGTNKSKKNKTSLMLNGGYPETFGANIGYTVMNNKINFYANTGIKHRTKFQTKEHLRENYENPDLNNYYQFDRQDMILNNAFLNTNFNYKPNKKQKIGLSFIASKEFNNADRAIDYETLSKIEETTDESLKKTSIDLDNYSINGRLNYRYKFNKNKILTSKIYYSYFDQLQVMNNETYPDPTILNSEQQNTFSKQINKTGNFSVDYSHSFSDSVLFETGYNFNRKDLNNNFNAENYQNPEWIEDPALNNKFNYIQMIHALYLNVNVQLKYIDFQAGLRGEYTEGIQNNTHTGYYFNLFPSVNISRKINKHYTLFAGYNRRINRPTIKMLNPFSNEYVDLLNMHKGNPDLKPEYVNSFEMGNRFVYNKFSGMASIYYRNINEAVSRVKYAINDSATSVSFMNLDKAKLIGGEISLTNVFFDWWSLNTNCNIFHTNLSGEYGKNHVDNNRVAWNINVVNNLKIVGGLKFQIAAYYRSKLPSVMGIYKERYYIDVALSKKIFKNKAQLTFKISDVLNTYKFGLDLDAIDYNNYRYSQINRKEFESRYFILSIVYNIDSNKKQQKKFKKNFFLEGFDK